MLSWGNLDRRMNHQENRRGLESEQVEYNMSTVRIQKQ